MALSSFEKKWFELMGRAYGSNAMNNRWYSAMAGQNSGGGSSSSTGYTPSTAPLGKSFRWSFPQYSQTWAFTPPPNPQSYNSPPAFDPKTSTGYAAPPKAPTTTKSASTPFSVTDLMAKYK
jgi:hypothetical protein